MLFSSDLQMAVAISTEFMTDQRYAAWYEQECDSRSGTPGIWSDLGWVAYQVISAERYLGVDWANHEFMEAVFAIVDRMYEGGLEQNWTDALKEILDEQKVSIEPREGD